MFTQTRTYTNTPIFFEYAQEKRERAEKMGVNYSTFGVTMKLRDFVKKDYRYHFNGKEKDDDWTGNSGDSYDFGARMYDSRLGRWWCVDPLEAKYPNMSPYHYVDNSPLRFIDPDGKSAVMVIDPSTKTVTVQMNLKFYGDVTDEQAKSWATQAQSDWNAANGTVTLKVKNDQGVEEDVVYNVKFEITGEKISKNTAETEMQTNTDTRNNFIEVTEKRITSTSDVGGNTAQWSGNQLERSPNTASHEVGHLLGWWDTSGLNTVEGPGHDFIGEANRPGIMTPSSANTTNSSFAPEYYYPTNGGIDNTTIIPEKRNHATQRDIGYLHLDMIAAAQKMLLSEDKETGKKTVQIGFVKKSNPKGK